MTTSNKVQLFSTAIDTRPRNMSALAAEEDAGQFNANQLYDARFRLGHRCENILISSSKVAAPAPATNQTLKVMSTASRRSSTASRLLSSHSVMALLIVVALSQQQQLAWAQCPWARESAELHADCICDFNPSQPTSLTSEQQTLELHRPVNRMSVQCAPVDFNLLLGALRQTASVELPGELLTPTSGNSTEDALKISAGIQLASQAKLDLLHVSNSSIDQLTDEMFILDTQQQQQQSSNNTSRSARHLVVALQSLHLSRCGIERIQTNAFAGLEWSLTSLSLSDNQLEHVPMDSISRLSNLKILDLSNNRISHLAGHSFCSLSKLSALRLADNKIGGQRHTSAIAIPTTPTHQQQQPPIDLQAFAGLENSLTDLNLKNTQLDEFPRAIVRLKHLAFLNLAQNQISQVPPRSFSEMNSLTAINLERNRISAINDETFAGVEGSLSSLSFLGNLLSSFPARQLRKLRSLRRLDMGFNEIDTLPADAFLGNSQLILIALDGNPLETLPEQAFKSLEGTLRGLSIGGKTLDCDCRMSWMLRWQQDYNLQISSRERQPQFCAKPHYLRSLVSLAALKPEHLTCSEPTSITMAAQTSGYATETSQSFHLTNMPAGTTRYWPMTSLSTLIGPTTTLSFTSPTPTTTTSLPPTTIRPSAATDASKQLETTTRALLGNDLSETSTDAEDINRLSSDSGSLTIASTVTSLAEKQEPTSSSISLDFIAPPTATRMADLAHQSIRREPSGEFHPPISSNSELPEDELFVASTETDSQRKSNRNGFHWPTTPLSKNEHVTPLNQSGQPDDMEEQIRRNATLLISQAIQSIHAADMQRKRKTTSTQSRSQANQHRQRLKPIHSVFGDRAPPASSTSKRVSVGSSTESPHVVPAVPTTINVYKTPATHKPPQGDHQSSHLAQAQSFLAKNPRFIEETIGSVRQIDWSTLTTTSTTSTSSPIATIPITATIIPAPSNPRFSDLRRSPSAERSSSDVDRYTVSSSNIQLRLQTPTTMQPNATTSSRRSSEISDLGSRNAILQRVSEIPLTPTMTTSSRIGSMAPNNTRMSVSSMYRLTKPQIASTPIVSSSTTTTAPPAFMKMSNQRTTTARLNTMVYSRPTSKSRTYNTTTESVATTQMSSEVPISTITAPEQRLAEATTRMAATVRIVDSLPTRATMSEPATSRNWDAKLLTSSTTPTLPSSFTTSSSTTRRPHEEDIQARHHSSSVVEIVVPTVTSTLNESKLITRNKSIPMQVVHQIPLLTSHDPQLVVTGHGKQATTTTAPRPPVAAPTTTNSVKDQEQQIDQTLNLRPTGTSSVSAYLAPTTTAAITHSPHATAPPEQRQATLGGGEMRTLKDSTSRHQSRDDAQTVREDLIVKPGRFAFGNIIRLEDTDQLALILAGVLCIFIMVIAITTACICYAPPVISSSPGESNQTSILSNFSSSEAKLHTGRRRANLRRPPQPGFLRKVLCCCLGNGSRYDTRITPTRSLVLQDDDDNSTGSDNSKTKITYSSQSYRSAPVAASERQRQLLFESIRSASLKLERKSANQRRLHQLQKNQTIDKRSSGERNKKSNGFAFDLEQHFEFDNRLMKPLDHEAAILNHKQAHAMDQEYFISKTNDNRPRKTSHNPRPKSTNKTHPLARIGSTFTVPSEANLLNIIKRPADGDEEWVRDDAETPSSSCDSDKSCSPSANKNNRYNISEAHRAHLSPQNGATCRKSGKLAAFLPIQTNRFVQTTTGDLLATVPSHTGLNEPNSMRHLDYLDMSSDRSTTDDSRTPLSKPVNSSRWHEYRTQRPGTGVETFTAGRTTMARSRSSCRLNQEGVPSGEQRQFPTNNESTGEFFNSELVPMSAEDEWPEPYVDPADNMLVGGSLIGDRLVQYKSTTSRNQHAVDPSLQNYIQQRSQQSESANRIKSHGRTNSIAFGGCLDDSYLSNWHSVSRSGRVYTTNQQIAENRATLQQQKQQQSLDNRYRSNPGGLDNHNFLNVGGATNWLRWTPHPPADEHEHRSSQQLRQSVGNLHNHSTRNTITSTISGGWHQDNQIESMYVDQSHNH